MHWEQARKHQERQRTLALRKFLSSYREDVLEFLNGVIVAAELLSFSSEFAKCLLAFSVSPLLVAQKVKKF